jgi:hypothetical protein
VGGYAQVQEDGVAAVDLVGGEGTLEMSEASGRGTVYREAWVPAENWEKWTKMDFIRVPPKKEEAPAPAADTVLDVRESPKPPSYDIPVTMEGKIRNRLRLLTGSSPAPVDHSIFSNKSTACVRSSLRP